tara:strand:+ start:2543 stop:2875 length:333 start_codon:yes stop_codon:yes gene_type:complete
MPDTSGFKQDHIGSYIEKDPDAELFYTIDWSSWLPTSELLTASTFSVSTITDDPNPMVVGSTSIINANKSVVRLTGGTAGYMYTVTNTITTDNDEVDTRRFRIKLEARYL